MKIIILGGGGRVGRRIAELARARNLGTVTIADKFLGSVDDTFDTVQLDAADDDSLIGAMTGQDLVINCIGPFDRWGARVLDKAIEVGVDYIDICDDPGPTLELLERDTDAKEAGVRAVVGLGASPGLANLLAVVAARQLDEVDLLVNYWGDPNEDVPVERAPAEAERVAAAFRSGRAALTHAIAQASNEIPVWRDGALGTIRAWTPPYRIRLSSGESGLFRPIGHPEPVTVPRTVPVKHCICIGTLGAGADKVMEEVLGELEQGTISENDAPNEVARRILEEPLRLVSTRTDPPLPALIGAVAIGRLEGAARSVTVMPGGPTDGSMSSETARPCVLGVEMISEVRPGVHAPESAFDAEEFLRRFSAHEWANADPYRIDVLEATMFELAVDDDAVTNDGG